MKKRYVSPTVEVEQFVLTQSIAACQQTITVNANDVMCVFLSDAPDAVKDFVASGYLWDGFIGCQEIPKDPGWEDGICYHTSINLLFNSQ